MTEPGSIATLQEAVVSLEASGLRPSSISLWEISFEGAKKQVETLIIRAMGIVLSWEKVAQFGKVELFHWKP